MKTAKLMSVITLGVASLVLANAAVAQTDAGPQKAQRCTTQSFNGTSFQVCTGSPLASVQADSPAGIASFFADALARFQDVESVSNSPNGNNGLGPRFNFNECSGCHVTPAVGGTGGTTNFQFAGFGSCTTGAGAGPGGVSQTAQNLSVFTPGQPFTPAPTNQQVGTIVCNNTNIVPAFITANGPTREARFPFFFNADGTVNTNNPNGGVEDLFTVTGRQDGATKAGCSLQQPSFAQAAAANNLIFRIPTPVFGMGLIENLDDSALLNNAAANANNSFGIGGTFNHNGNDGTITRFGWKAQNKSAHIFAGEAYNVEMGITNLLFGNEKPLPGEDGNGGSGGLGLPANCLNLTGTGYPEDNSNPANGLVAAAPVLDDVSAFANFMRSLAAPVTGNVVLNGTTVSASSIANGRSLFTSIGCATCHNPTPGTTQVSNFTGSLSQAPVNSFSDIELHHMGTGLADNVSQGVAGGDQFRTAPLWGVGQRVFLLHDGRTTSLITAINQHDSNGSEADIPVDNFQALTASQQQDVLNFLRSL